MDFFTIKKVAGTLLTPLPIITLLLIVSVYAIATHKKRMSIMLNISCIAMLLLFATPFLPNNKLSQIEQTYSQFDLAQKVSHIVILGCGYTDNAALPVTSQVYKCTAIRTLEAMRLQQHNPDSVIISSGGLKKEPFSIGEMNRELLISVGVPEHSIIVSDGSRDTAEEAVNLIPVLRDKSFALVTSASHIQRAMQIFEEQGLSPIAAPTDHLVTGDNSESPDWYYMLPSARNIEKTERWWYESMGQTWTSFISWWNEE